MYMNGHSYLDSHTSRNSTEFKSKSGYDSKKFCGVSVEELPVIEETVEKKHLYLQF